MHSRKWISSIRSSIIAMKCVKQLKHRQAFYRQTIYQRYAQKGPRPSPRGFSLASVIPFHFAVIISLYQRMSISFQHHFESKSFLQDQISLIIWFVKHLKRIWRHEKYNPLGTLHLNATTGFQSFRFLLNTFFSVSFQFDEINLCSLVQSPEGSSSLPSLCSPNSMSHSDEFAFMSTSLDNTDIDLSMRAPYIPMNESDDLPLLTEDLMWSAFSDELSLHKDIKEATALQQQQQQQQQAHLS